MGPRMLGKDLEDDFRSVDNSRLDVKLEVALLTRTEIVVADDEIELALELHVAQRFDFAHPDEMRGVDLAVALKVGADDVGACGARQIGELGHLVTDCLRARPGQQNAKQVSALARRTSCDQRLIFLILFMASSNRSSGAVTDNRK